MQPRPPWLPILGRTRAAVFVVDARQRIVLWNPGAERLLGYSAARVLGTPCHRVIAGVHGGEPWCHVNCRVQREVRCEVLPSDVEVLTHRRSGKPIWVAFSILAIPADGTHLVAHLMRDVTSDRGNASKIGGLLALLVGAGAPGDERRARSPAPFVSPANLLHARPHG